MHRQLTCVAPLFMACAAMALTSSAGASLSVFHWERPDPLVYDPALPGDYSYMDLGGAAQINDDGGVHSTIDASYDDVTQLLTWTVSFEGAPDGNASHQTNGFWLVLSGGPLPTGMGGETAQFFFDASGPTPVLTAYAYNGSGSGTSWFDASAPLAGSQEPDRILSSLADPGVVTDISFQESGAGSTMSFTVDASVINEHTPSFPSADPWQGVGFSSEIGIWFHALTQVETSYDGDGYLTQFDYGRAGWWDGAGIPVPEPGSIALIALAGGTCARIRRKRR